MHGHQLDVFGRRRISRRVEALQRLVEDREVREVAGQAQVLDEIEVGAGRGAVGRVAQYGLATQTTPHALQPLAQRQPAPLGQRERERLGDASHP